jgi:hypothetical protein
MTMARYIIPQINGLPRNQIELSDMDKSIILFFAFISLACLSLAAPLQLSGNSGREILGEINVSNSSNESSTLNNTEDLWSWGKLPVGHFINGTSGRLAARPVIDDGLVVMPPRGSSE